MKLQGINCQVPSKKISNEEIIDLVKYYSKPLYNGSINELISYLEKFFSITGIESRFWRGPKEKPIDLIKQTTEEALRKANITANKIDAVIYSSIHRGFIEPANANIICQELGLQTQRNFDITDACMGWCTASHIAQSLLKTEDQLHNILIISSECPMDKNGSILPENFKIKNREELHWKVPSLTLGEAVSSSIFQKSKRDNKYEFIEKSQYADLCTIPLFNYNGYSTGRSRIQDKKEMQFSAYGSELSTKGIKHAIGTLQNLLDSIDYTPNIIFPHAVSKKVIDFASNKLSMKSSVYSTFVELGNTATSSIPSAIYKAILNNKLKRGDKSIGWVASAGMKFSAFEIYY